MNVGSHLKPYILPDNLPVGTRLIFHRDFIPANWAAREYVLEESSEWWVCEKVKETDSGGDNS